MSGIPPIIVTDRECLQAWRRRNVVSLRPLVERYVALVYSSACRRTGSAEHAVEVTRAVFLVLARRAASLRKKTVLAGWLFHVTTCACRKLGGQPKLINRWRCLWFWRIPRGELPLDTTLWDRVAPELDGAIKRLSSAQREAVLLRVLLNFDRVSAATILRASERSVQKRVERGLKKLTRQFRDLGVTTDAESLAQVCSAEACATPLPEGLPAATLALIEASIGRKPSLNLARRTLNTLAWARWRRRVLIGVPGLFLMLAVVAGIAWHVDSLTGHSRLITMFLIWSAKHEGKTVPGLAQPARAWPTDATSPRLNAAGVRTARDLYQTTNIWLAHLRFSPVQWAALEPERIEPLPHLLQPDGTVLLRHPQARRNGLAGVLGFDFNWTHANFDFGGVTFTNVAVRVKGNGTYLGSLYGDKRPFKVDLNKFAKGQKLGGVDEFTFNNLVNDHSFLSDALAYEFFREAGVPASRTAYAYLSVSVEQQWERKPLGLYVMVEAVDEDFALERFGSKRVPVFKPVTYELFKHLGDEWSAYEGIYDLKTRATADQKRRVIDFAGLMTFASDAEFAERLGDFLDLGRFARYLACEVLLSNYDSFLSNGQNFYLYLDPGSSRFGFIPWDLDLSWGAFFLLGSRREREQASIWHPWVGRNRFLERVMAVEPFRQLYRAQLEDLLLRRFVPARLKERVDEVGKAIRSPIAAESDFRFRKFEEATSDKRSERSPGKDEQGANRPAHQIKRFVEARAKSVREQLDGKSDGIILQRSKPR
jgi:DNA-directed RNA polymerase specialized sigma24 family protein